MSTGVIPLTSNDGLRSTLKEHEASLLFPHGDSEALAEKLLWVKELQSEKYMQLSTQIRGIVTRDHGLVALIQKILGLLQ